MRNESITGRHIAASPLDRTAVRRLVAVIVLLAAALFPATVFAHPFSVTECVEGGDFIKNAALARDSGVSEAGFIDRIRSDIEVIQAFPPQLRWFVQDDDDAQFLIAAATDVFRHPRAAHAHQTDFFKACLGKTGAASPGRL